MKHDPLFQWIEHEGIFFQFRLKNQKRDLIFVGTEKNSDENLPEGLPLFQMAVVGRTNGFMQMLVSGVTEIPLESVALDPIVKGETVVFPYFHSKMGLRTEVTWEFVPGIKLVRSSTKVINESAHVYRLTHLSSGIWSGLSQEGLREWWDTEKWKVHTCRSGWKREGQWKEDSLSELGLYPVAEPLPIRSAAHLSSIGTYSTVRWSPTALLENQEAGLIYYAQIESAGAWHHEWSFRGTQTRGSLYWQMDVANETIAGWSKELPAGGSYGTETVGFGVCRGGFNEGVAELTRYRRACLKAAAPWTGEVPLVFNDYMNCWWGDPTAERLIPLIEKTAELGVEVFCIDAGWFGKKGVDWNFGLGDWMPGDDRFGAGGLQSILKFIQSKKMIPGIWLELEVCGEQTLLAKRPEEWFLRRHGARVGGGDRWFLDLSHHEVREYLHGVVDRLVAMGVGYFKNDYNSCIGYGADQKGESSAQGVLDHLHSFYSFIEEVKQRHPRLILENCGGGGLRQDYGTLSHFHLQSFSDVEVYTEAPSILSGSLANVLPEQLGIWCYPLPYLYEDYLRHPHSDELPSYASMADGEQTIFNGVNGLCGNLYLSGRLDGADALNQSLLQEALALYKKERGFIASAVPYFPLGQLEVMNHTAWHTIGLLSEKSDRLLLAVWRLRSDQTILEIPLPCLKGKKITVKQLYPEKSHFVPTYWNANQSKLTIQMPEMNQARYFECTSTEES